MSEATIAKGKKWTDELKERFDNFDKKARLPLVLKNVHIYYLCHKEGGVKKFGATGNTLLDKEYCVQVLINEKIQKQLKKLHKKTAVKEYTAKEFKEVFKCDPPYKADEYVVIRLGNNAGYRSGDDILPLDPPTVLDKYRESLADIAVGNGSLATVGISLTPYVHDTYGKGTSLNFGMIKVSELIEYKSEGGTVDDEDDFDFEESTDDGSEFDDADFDDDSDEMPDDDENAELKAQLEAQKKAQAEDDDSDDDDIFS